MRKKTKRNTAVAAAAVVASASVLVGGVFAEPGELLDDAEPVQLHLDDEDAAAEGGAAELEERRGLRARCRAWLLRLPWGVRATLVLPLWALGWLLLSGAQLLWTGALAPLAGRFAGWILLAALALGVFALGAKAVFPDLPLKKILKRRNVFALLGGVCVLGAADALLPLLWEEYEGWREAIGMAASFLLVLGALCFFSARETKRRRTPQKETQQQALRRVLQMADSAK